MNEKITSIVKNKTWDLIPPQPGIKIIFIKWIYKVKIDHSPSKTRLKARLVARGFQKIEGIDFTDTFSQVVKWDTVHLITFVVASHNWHIFHLDIKIAFLNGPIHESVYIHQPQGLVVPRL